MDFPVPDVTAKLNGAEDRLDKLIEQIRRGAVTELITTATDRDRHGRVRVRVKEIAEVPQEWHVWIGESVHDMRSALDHLAFALNVIGSGSNPPPNWKSSQFPIYSRSREFRAMAKKRRDKCPVGFFPRGTRTVVERLQPYHRWPHRNWLEALADLSNIDKHRRFPVTAVLPVLLGSVASVEGHRVVSTKWARYRPLKPNTTLMWLEVPTLPSSVKEPNVGFPYACGLNFHEEPAKSLMPLTLPLSAVDAVLPAILDHLRETVLPAFEPFLE